MKIEISEEGIVFCDGLTCDPVSMYESCAQCGGCPFVPLIDRYLEAYFDGACEPR